MLGMGSHLWVLGAACQPSAQRCGVWGVIRVTGTNQGGKMWSPWQ